jgi:hypothetical protein
VSRARVDVSDCRVWLPIRGGQLYAMNFSVLALPEVYAALEEAAPFLIGELVFTNGTPQGEGKPFSKLVHKLGGAPPGQTAIEPFHVLRLLLWIRLALFPDSLVNGRVLQWRRRKGKNTVGGGIRVEYGDMAENKDMPNYWTNFFKRHNLRRVLHEGNPRSATAIEARQAGGMPLLPTNERVAENTRHSLAVALNNYANNTRREPGAALATDNMQDGRIGAMERGIGLQLCGGHQHNFTTLLQPGEVSGLAAKMEADCGRMYLLDEALGPRKGGSFSKELSPLWSATEGTLEMARWTVPMPGVFFPGFHVSNIILDGVPAEPLALKRLSDDIVALLCLVAAPDRVDAYSRVAAASAAAVCPLRSMSYIQRCFNHSLSSPEVLARMLVASRMSQSITGFDPVAEIKLLYEATQGRFDADALRRARLQDLPGWALAGGPALQLAPTESTPENRLARATGMSVPSPLAWAAPASPATPIRKPPTFALTRSPCPPVARAEPGDWAGCIAPAGWAGSQWVRDFHQATMVSRHEGVSPKTLVVDYCSATQHSP